MRLHLPRRFFAFAFLAFLSAAAAVMPLATPIPHAAAAPAAGGPCYWDYVDSSSLGLGGSGTPCSGPSFYMQFDEHCGSGAERPGCSDDFNVQWYMYKVDPTTTPCTFTLYANCQKCHDLGTHSAYCFTTTGNQWDCLMCDPGPYGNAGLYYIQALVRTGTCACPGQLLTEYDIFANWGGSDWSMNGSSGCSY